ncbi:MAG TPA: nuclease-related domain-containing protein [Actinomycetota bacterium]|nr:nuclease-related domain-containing protein [Actinomycetota bacterium]
MVLAFLWLLYLVMALMMWALFHGDAVRRIREWVKGVPGEMEVRELLGELESHGYKLLRDVPVRGMAVPAVAVGPTGVFAIHTKSWWPMYVSIRDRVLNGSWEKDQRVHQLRRASAELRDRLRAVEIEVNVETLLVLTRVGLPSGPVKLDNLTMIDPTTLLPFVLTRPRTLSSNQVTMAVEAIPGGIPVAAAKTRSSQTRSAPRARGKTRARRREDAQGASSTKERTRQRRRARSPEQSPTPPARV